MENSITHHLIRFALGRGTYNLAGSLTIHFLKLHTPNAVGLGKCFLGVKGDFVPHLLVQKRPLLIKNQDRSPLL